MRVRFRQNEIDSEMLEVTTTDDKGNRYIWALVHNDLFCGEEGMPSVLSRLNQGETVELELKVPEECP